MTDIVIGIFVGGAGKRMGGVPKGLLKVPAGDETLLARLLRVCQEAAPSAAVFLVGEASLYGAYGTPCVQDNPARVGPIGGLHGLLLEAESAGARVALALACDLPFLDRATIAQLLAPDLKAARVPVVAGRLQPLAAAYAPSQTLAAVKRALAADQHALMAVLEELGTEVQRLDFGDSEVRALLDWDTPEDIIR